MKFDFNTMTLATLREGLQNKDFTSVELTKFFLTQSEEKNKEMNAFLEIFDDAMTQAKEADVRIQAGEDQSLLGIPIAIKDNMLIEGKKVSAGSKMLEHYRATFDAFVIEKLRAQGVVFMGRTNLDEFAMGSSTENSAFGVVKNPHDVGRVAGGSSGGSAAAVSMQGVPISLGSDTGGSIRQPAAFCGCVGFKPTYGTVSRSGLIAMGSSLDQIGSFGKSVSDVETVFDAIKGYDPKDSTSLVDPQFVSAKDEPMTIGVPRTLFEKGVSSDVLEHFEHMLTYLEKQGHTLKEIELPYVKYSLPAYYIIMSAEASTNLSRYDGVKYGLRVQGANLSEEYIKTRGAGFGREVRRRILLGTYVLSSGYYDAYYGKATAVRDMITTDFDNAFKQCDVIATPTCPSPAFKIGEIKDPVSMYLADIFTVPANIAGIPAISIPMGSVTRNNIQLPTGFQLMAPHLHEQTLFSLSKEVEVFES